MTGGWRRAPPPPRHPAWAEFTLMMEYAPESGQLLAIATLCTLLMKLGRMGIPGAGLDQK
jgi:hypothetical protein